MADYPDDKKLVKQLLAGDERAFDQFFDENFARLYRFAVARLPGDTDAALDVAQIALTKAVRKLDTYRGESALFTWLCAICRNELNDWLRRQGRLAENVVLIEDFPEVRAAIDSMHAPAFESPERQYRRVETLRLIQVALDNLPPKYGDVLEWKYVQGWTVREIGSQLGISYDASQSLLARAKRAFAEVYSALLVALNEDGEEWVRQ